MGATAPAGSPCSQQDQHRPNFTHRNGERHPTTRYSPQPPGNAPDPGEQEPPRDTTAPGHGPQRGAAPGTQARRVRPARPPGNGTPPAASTTPGRAHQPAVPARGERRARTKGDTEKSTPPEPKSPHPRRRPFHSRSQHRDRGTLTPGEGREQGHNTGVRERHRGRIKDENSAG